MIVAGLLLLGEEHVAVIRHALKYAGQAGSADALFARHGDVDAMALQYLDHSFVGRNLEDLAAAAQPD